MKAVVVCSTLFLTWLSSYPAVASQPGGSAGFRPQKISTAPLKMTGRRPEPQAQGADPSAGFRSKVIRTAAVRMTGNRPEPESAPADLSSGYRPRRIGTAAIRMTGRRN
jgi:hypothetical protein